MWRKSAGTKKRAVKSANPSFGLGIELVVGWIGGVEEGGWDGCGAKDRRKPSSKRGKKS